MISMIFFNNPVFYLFYYRTYATVITLDDAGNTNLKKSVNG